MPADYSLIDSPPIFPIGLMQNRERIPELESALAYPGWRVVSASIFGVMFGYSVLVPYTFSLFVKPLSAEFGWRRDQISLALTCVALTVAMCSPLIGWVIDNWGPRPVIITCSLTLGTAFASLCLLTSHITQLYATFVLLGLAGNGTTQLAYSRAICTWFLHKRGVALSLVSAGAGVGAMLLPVATAWLIQRFGWRSAYGIVGTTVVIASVPLVSLLVRDCPCYEKEGRALVPAKREDRVASTAPFVLLSVAIFLYSVSFNAILSHLSPLLTDRGISFQGAAIGLSVIGLSGLAGRIVIGYILDRLFAARVSMALFLFTAAAIFLMASGSIIGAYIGAGLLGFAAGGESDITPYLLSRYYSLRRFSFLYGCAWTAFAAGTALGPYLMGVLFTRTGSYQARGIEMLALPALASAVLMLFMPHYSSTKTRLSLLWEPPILRDDPIISDP